MTQKLCWNYKQYINKKNKNFKMSAELSAQF